VRAFLARMLGRSEQARARRHVRRAFPGVSMEPGVVLKGDPRNLRLHGRVQLQAGVVLHAGGMPWCENAGHLEIGDGAVVSPHTVIYGAGPGGVRIGCGFDCGPGVGIFASRTDYEKGPEHHVFAPVVIGDGVVLFAHVVIGPGVSVGDGAVVAANSVVTRDVPPRTLVGGAPARPIRTLAP
jgi:acetyltransferase-like isoleucine patch superfamily enzyme